MYIFPGARRSFAQQVRPYSIDLLFLLIFDDMLSPADAACPCDAKGGNATPATQYFHLKNEMLFIIINITLIKRINRLENIDKYFVWDWKI